MTEPNYIALARTFIGLKETKGAEHNPEILQMWKDIKRSGIKDDETPWCAAFVGAMLERSGIRSTRFEGARSYLDWGTAVTKPLYGAVAVLTREGGGHVAFVVGQDEKGNILLLGGNQGDEVNIKAFPTSRITGYRVPVGVQLDLTAPLQLGSAPISTREA